MLKSVLVTQLATELDDPTNSDLTTLLSDWIDEIVSDLANRFDWEFLNVNVTSTLNSGTNTVTVDGIVDIKKIQRTDIDIIIPIKNLSWIMSRGYDLAASGPPYYAYIDSFIPSTQAYIINFNNVADANYPLLFTCLKEIGPIASGVDLPIPLDLLVIVKNGVRALFYAHEENLNSTQYYESKMERGIINILKSRSKITAIRTQSKPNSDLAFSNVKDNYDVNLDLNRIIEE